MFTELHCKTNYSFLQGASHADELVARAAELGYHALAVTDVNSLAGVVRAHVAAKEVGLKLIVGAEITPRDAPPVVLWATDRAAYGRLARLITVGRRRAPKGECELTLADVLDHSAGLLAGVVADDATHLPSLSAYREALGERCHLLIELHRGPDDPQRLDVLTKLSRRSNLPLLAAGDVRYHAPSRMPLYDVLTAVRHGVTVAEATDRLLPNAQRHLRPLDEIAAVYAAIPEAVQRTMLVARQCRFSLDELRYEYPEELAPAGMTPTAYLQQLTWEGARRRYPLGVPAAVRQTLQHELALIAELRYEAYFLTVWDLVRFARSRGILCQGRGSAANSAVCYCLGVTAVDPARVDLLFERFISRERDEAPDIDVDFEHERREEVLQYLYGKYGRERAGLAAAVITYRTRSAVRDVGKALGLSLDRVDALAKNTEGYHRESNLPDRCRQVGIDPDGPLGRRLVHLVEELIGFPRHLSQHVGGMVITRGPLCELTPIENAAMDDRTVVQWDKDDLEALGILKVDCLCLGMLSAIRKCFQLISKHHQRRLTLADVPPDDAAVYDMICRADTVGVFQIESRAQMSMLPRLRPRCYYDLVIEVAIVRPGPIQGQMVHPYLRRRRGDEPVEYPSEAIRQVLEKTLGVPIFQEQAMRLAVVAAGFTPGEADQLRRAMGAWRRRGVIERFQQKLIDGMRQRGLSAEFAEQVFRQIRGFGEYGFPESHAASFALLAYVSAWLKHHYPAAFTAALLNSQPMGFYAPAQLVRDARDHGVSVLPVDVNRSEQACTLEATRWDGGTPGSEQRGQSHFHSASLCENRDSPQRVVERRGQSHFHCASLRENRDSPRRVALRLGFRMVLGLAQRDAERIVQSRAAGPFASIDDFARRTGLGRPTIVRLAEADAFASLGGDRRQTLWQALAQQRPARPQPLLDALPDDESPPPTLPAQQPEHEVFADYQSTGLSLRGHPIAFYRSQLDRLQVAPASHLARIDNAQRVCVAGLVLLRQRPSTAKGITFVTLEDETGTINLVVHQRVWQRFGRITRSSPAWLVHGKLESKDSVIHVVAQRLEDLSQGLHRLRSRSRDFR